MALCRYATLCKTIIYEKSSTPASNDSDNCPAIDQSMALSNPSWMDVIAPSVQSVTVCKVNNMASATTEPVKITQ